MSKRKESFPLDPPNYAERVQQLEARGMTTSDAQGVADAEIMRHGAVQLEVGHTQGPWKTNRGGVEGPNGEPICAGQFNSTRGVSLAACNANLRLIAAAPDLLAESAAFVADFQAYIDSDGYDLPDSSALLAAIAKARGRA